jgi:hypothetical protein
VCLVGSYGFDKAFNSRSATCLNRTFPRGFLKAKLAISCTPSRSIHWPRGKDENSTIDEPLGMETDDRGL